MSTPDGPGPGTASKVKTTVSKLGKTDKEALEKLSKGGLRVTLVAQQRKWEFAQHKIFSKAVMSHIAKAKGGTPKKLHFKFDTENHQWRPDPGGPYGLTFVVLRKGGGRIEVPKALSSAVGAELPSGWTWESKDTTVAPDYDTTLYADAFKKHESSLLEEQVKRQKEQHSTKGGGYKFEARDGDEIYLRIGESSESFLLKIGVSNATAFKERGGMLFLEVDGQDYRVARKSSRVYYSTMDAYVGDAEIALPSTVTKASKITFPFPNKNFELVAPVTGSRFYNMDVVRERVDDNPENDIYEVEPAGELFEKIVGPGDGRACRVGDRPDFGAETCNGTTIYLERTGFTRRPAGAPALVTGAAALHERCRWVVAQRFGLESREVTNSSGQFHCFAGNWEYPGMRKRVRIHYSIAIDTVAADDNFDATTGHLTLELGNWVLGNNLFYRYWFDGSGVVPPAGGTTYAYGRYRANGGTATETEFCADVETALAAIGQAFSQLPGF
jgi:hypothetical protein